MDVCLVWGKDTFVRIIRPGKNKNGPQIALARSDPRGIDAFPAESLNAGGTRNEVLSSKPKTTEAKNYRVKRSADVVEWKEGVCTLRTHVEACAPSSSAPSDARLPELVVTLPLFVVVQDLFSGKSFQSKNTTSTREWSESEAVQREQQTWSKHTCRVCRRYVLVHTEVVIWPYVYTNVSPVKPAPRSLVVDLPCGHPQTCNREEINRSSCTTRHGLKRER